MEDQKDFFTLLLEANFKMRVDWFRELNKDAEKGGIVLVGDSLTQEFPIHEMMNAYGKIHNRGIGGDTTEGLLKRMNESIFDLEPSKVFLQVGTNDLTKSQGNYSQLLLNMDIIINLTLSSLNNVNFHLISLYPVNNTDEIGIDKFSVSIRTNEMIDEVNSELIKLALSKNITYLDFNSLLKDETGNLNRLYTREGLHISPAGYRLILRELKKYF